MGLEIKNILKRQQPFVGKCSDEDESSSLQIGNECLDKFYGDAKAAILKFPEHSTEIVLASLFNELVGSSIFDESLMRHLHTLISACDQTNYRIN